MDVCEKPSTEDSWFVKILGNCLVSVFCFFSVFCSFCILHLSVREVFIWWENCVSHSKSKQFQLMNSVFPSHDDFCWKTKRKSEPKKNNKQTICYPLSISKNRQTPFITLQRQTPPLQIKINGQHLQDTTIKMKQLLLQLNINNNN